MEELEVTRLWMAGVVGLMAVFGVIALTGYVLRAINIRNNGDSDE